MPQIAEKTELWPHQVEDSPFWESKKGRKTVQTQKSNAALRFLSRSNALRCPEASGFRRSAPKYRAPYTGILGTSTVLILAQNPLARSADENVTTQKNYQIIGEELEWLAKRVSNLQELTERICKEKIASFTR